MNNQLFASYCKTLSENCETILRHVVIAECESWIDWIEFDGTLTPDKFMDLLRMRIQCLKEGIPFTPYNLSFPLSKDES